MAARSIRTCFNFFFSVAFLTFLAPSLRAAETDLRDKAINMAFAEAKSEDSLEAQESKERSAQEYRQKLDAVITEKKEDEFSHEVDSYIRYLPGRTLNAQPGKISVIDSAFEYSYTFKAFGQLPVEISLQSGYAGIEEKDVRVSLPANLTNVGLGIETTLPFFKFDKTYFRMSLNPSFHSQNWEARSSAFRMPVHSFVIYQPDEKWTFIAGVAVYPDYDSPVLPIIGFIYKPNDKWTFNLIPERPTISYAVNEHLTIFAEGSISCDEYEVTKDGRKGVILTYNENYAGGGIKYSFNKYLNASISTGAVFNHYLRYEDSLGKIDIKNGQYCEFRVEARL